MNDLTLGDSHPVTEELKPIKVGGNSTAIETAQHGNGARINGDLEVTGTAPSDDTKLPLAGGTMTGDLGMGSADITASDGFTIDVSGDMSLDVAGNDIALKSGGNTGINLKVGGAPIITMYESSGATDDYCTIQASTSGATIITTVDAAGADADFKVVADGDITLDSETGVFDIKKSGTKFADMYAGMILGYTNIGLNEAHASYNLTTSYVVPTDEFSVSFVAPPSGNVEIFAQISFNAGSSGAGDLHAGLSSANATSGYSALQSYHEEKIIDGSGRSGIESAQIYWTLTGLTAGTSYEYWAGFKSSSTTGTPLIQWGGNAANRWSDFIMKATALPATITT